MSVDVVRRAFSITSTPTPPTIPVTECNACLSATKENPLGVKAVGAFSKAVLGHTVQNLKNLIDTTNYQPPSLPIVPHAAPLHVMARLAENNFNVPRAVGGFLENVAQRTDLELTALKNFPDTVAGLPDQIQSQWNKISTLDAIGLATAAGVAVAEMAWSRFAGGRNTAPKLKVVEGAEASVLQAVNFSHEKGGFGSGRPAPSWGLLPTEHSAGVSPVLLSTEKFNIQIANSGPLRSDAQELIQKRYGDKNYDVGDIRLPENDPSSITLVATNPNNHQVIGTLSLRVDEPPGRLGADATFSDVLGEIRKENGKRLGEMGRLAADRDAPKSLTNNMMWAAIETFKAKGGVTHVVIEVNPSHIPHYLAMGYFEARGEQRQHSVGAPSQLLIGTLGLVDATRHEALPRVFRTPAKLANEQNLHGKLVNFLREAKVGIWH